MAEVLVPLSEVATQLGGSDDVLAGWMRRAGVEATTDWAGRSALPVETAAKLVSSWQAEQASHAAKWSSYQRYLEQRERERYQAGEEAYAKAAQRQLELEAKHGDVFINAGPRPLSPAGRAFCREVRERALEDFDRKQKPPVPFERFDG